MLDLWGNCPRRTRTVSSHLSLFRKTFLGKSRGGFEREVVLFSDGESGRWFSLHVGSECLRTFLKSTNCQFIGWAKKCLRFFKIKHTFFIFTKNFIEKRIHPFVPLFVLPFFRQLHNPIFPKLLSF